MLSLSRRSFFGWLAALLPATVAGRRVWSSPRARNRLESHGRASAPLDDELLRALAIAVLPSELGADGAREAAANFQRWLADFRPSAEQLHGYGTGEIRLLPATPAAPWADQLRALDRAARKEHRAAFASLAADQRRALVRRALERERLERFPAPLAASHVAVALLSHFYASPAATDLCYRAEIGKNMCRPLARAVDGPVPIGRRTAR